MRSIECPSGFFTSLRVYKCFNSFHRKWLQLDRDAGRLETGRLHPASWRLRRKSRYFRFVGGCAAARCAFCFRSAARVQRVLPDHVPDAFRPAHRRDAVQLPHGRSRGTGTGSGGTSTGSGGTDIGSGGTGTGSRSTRGRRRIDGGCRGVRRLAGDGGGVGRSTARARAVRSATASGTAASDDQHQPRRRLLRRAGSTSTDASAATSTHQLLPSSVY